MSGWVSTRRRLAARPAVSSGGLHLSLTQLRWITIAVPILAITLLVHLAAFSMPEVVRTPVGFGVTVVLVLLAVSGFSHLVFTAIERLEARIVRQNEELRLANELSAELARARDLASILDVSLRRLLDVSGGTSGSFWSDADGKLSRAHQITAGGDGIVQETSRTEEDEEQRQEALRLGRLSVRARGGSTYLCLPLRSSGSVFGIASLRIPDASSMPAPARRSLEAIAEHIGPAISEALLRVRIREAAVIEERSRIAREMHDGLAQVVGYVNTKAFAIRRSLDRGDVATASSMLAELEEAARDVSVDVRESVSALRATSAGSTGLADAIAAYIKKYERMSGISVDYRVDGDIADLRISEMVQLHVLRIVQEALSNVRKHADVDRVLVRLSADDAHVLVCVNDDGRGFDPRLSRAHGDGHFGLQTMRERAQAAGCQLAVTSRKESGTCLSIQVPIAAAVESRT